MIHFITPWNQLWINQNLVERVPDDLKTKIKVISYHNLARKKKLQPGIYIFTGLAVLSNTEKQVAIEFSDILDNAGDSFKIINHPRKVLMRYDLLKILHNKGINHFSCYKIAEFLNEGIEPVFPVFIRDENYHTGSLSGLIRDAESLKKNIKTLQEKGYPEKNLLIVDFLDVSDNDGVFKKYSAFRLGDAILPRYLTVSDHWVVKENAPDPPGLTLYNNRIIREEYDYIKKNPHKEQLHKIFNIAGINYGRIDYGLFEGQLQVWEINTLPCIGRPPAYKKRERNTDRKLKRENAKIWFYKSLAEAVNDLNSNSLDSSISVNLSPGLRRMVFIDRIKHSVVRFFNSLRIQLPRLGFIQKMEKYIK